VQTENEKDVRGHMRDAFFAIHGEGKLDSTDEEFGLQCFKEGAAWQAALQSQSNTDGWVMVPVEPTFEMQSAIIESVLEDADSVSAWAVYKAMLSAAPKAPQQVSNTPQDGSPDQSVYNTIASRYFASPPQQQEQSGEAVQVCPECDIAGCRHIRERATPTATASQASREEQMVTLRADESGKPTVWCDPEIADLVDALNTNKLSTVASCSGHGHRPGRISLKDGRELLVMNSEQVATVERLFGTDINGASQKSAPGQEAVAYGLPNTAITGNKQALMQVRLDIPSNDQYGGALWVPLFLAPPTSTAIAAMVIKQAAEVCKKLESDLIELAASGFEHSIHDALEECAARISALTPAAAKEELVKVILKVINEAQEYTEEGVRRALDGEEE
jgi:hypothetical protein